MINREVLRIILSKGAGDSLLKKINEHISNGLPYTLSEICENEQIMCSLGVKEEVAKSIYKAKESALYLQDELYEKGIDMCWIGDNDYPNGIKMLKTGNIPATLFYKGNFNLVQQKCVGFTGSRKVSDSGILITENSAKQLSQDGITIVSGYAKGVDITAHRAALQEKGNTIFVIVEGILKNRIKGEIKELLNEKNHLFVSQFPPNLTWSASNAMKRNNTIIGLSNAMILIESGMDGGTFDAGEQSLRNKKPLFVVEYSAPKPSAEGNLYFLNRGGMPLRGDKEGKPILKRVYSSLEQELPVDNYEQIKLSI